jgi:hypothetical protein
MIPLFFEKVPPNLNELYNDQATTNLNFLEDNPFSDSFLCAFNDVIDSFKFKLINSISADLFENTGKYLDITNYNNELEKTMNFGKTEYPKKNEEEVPIALNFDAIKNILQKSNIPNKITTIFDVIDPDLKKIEKEICDSSFLKRKKRRKKGKIKFNEVKEKIKGRKKLDDLSKRKHSKFSADNIIKKVKSKFLDSALLFLNKILRAYLGTDKLTEYCQLLRGNKKEDCEIESLIKSLDYRLIDTIKKDNELYLLKQPLREIFSNYISSKYSTLPKDSNIKIIQLIIKEQSNNENIMFAFNLTFEEWIDIFVYKKKLNSIKNYDEEKMKDLEDKFNKIDKFILELSKNHDDNYLLYFVFYAFNYKRWFLLKKGRKRESKTRSDNLKLINKELFGCF